MNPIGLHSHEDKLLEFAYGELPPPEARAMEAHIKGCARCTGTLESIRGVRGVMSQLAPEPAPDAGLESLLAYAQQTAQRAQAERARKPAWWRRWFVLTSSLATAAVVALVVRQAMVESPPEAGMAKLEATAAKQERAEAKEYAQKDAAKPQSPPAQPLPVASANSYPQEAPPPPPQAQAQLGARVLPSSESSGPFQVEPVRDNKLVRREKSKASKVARDIAIPKEIAPESESEADLSAPASTKVAAADKTQAEDELRKEFVESAGKLRQTKQDSAGAGSSYAAKSEEYRSKKGAAQVAGDDEDNSLMGTRLSMRGSTSGGAPGRAASTSKAAELAYEAQQVAAPATAAPAATPAPVMNAPPPVNTRSLVAQADAAARGGDRQSEVRLLREAVAAGPSRAELEQLLTRLCNAEADAGLEPTGCEQLAREFPRSSGAQIAQKRMRAAVPQAAKAAKPVPADAAPAQRAPAAPAKAKAADEQYSR